MMSAIDAAVAAWDLAKPDCVVTQLSVGGNVKVVELAKTYPDRVEPRRMIIKFLVDDYRNDANPGASVRAELDRHEQLLDELPQQQA